MEKYAIKGITFIICLTAGLWGIAKISEQKCTYNIVVRKGQNNIVFKGINTQDTALRIIKFEDVAKGMEYYKAINIGDTLKLSRIKTKNFIYKNYYGFKFQQTRVREINDKTLKEIKEIAKRDSLLKQMQKVR